MRDKLPVVPGCRSCVYFYTHTDPIGKRQYGLTLHQGDHICINGRKARRLRENDIKGAPPVGCFKRKSPCELRVYTHKSVNDWWLHDALCRDLGEISPEGRWYAVKYEYQTILTPRDFWKRLESEPAEKLLGLSIACREIVEIDDGLQPVCFYKTEKGFRIEGSFDAERARKNELEECD